MPQGRTLESDSTLRRQAVYSTGTPSQWLSEPESDCQSARAAAGLTCQHVATTAGRQPASAQAPAWAGSL